MKVSDIKMFMPTERHVEVTLYEGLNAIQTGVTNKLFSDGLEENDYVHWKDGKGFCYSDMNIIGRTNDHVVDVLHGQGLCFKHKFYIEKTKGNGYMFNSKALLSVVNAQELVEKFTGMAKRNVLLHDESITSNDMLMQITGTIVVVSNYKMGDVSVDALVSQFVDMCERDSLLHSQTFTSEDVLAQIVGVIMLAARRKDDDQ